LRRWWRTGGGAGRGGFDICSGLDWGGFGGWGQGWGDCMRSNVTHVLPSCISPSIIFTSSSYSCIESHTSQHPHNHPPSLSNPLFPNKPLAKTKDPSSKDFSPSPLQCPEMPAILSPIHHTPPSPSYAFEKGICSPHPHPSSKSKRRYPPLYFYLMRKSVCIPFFSLSYQLGKLRSVPVLFAVDFPRCGSLSRFEHPVLVFSSKLGFFSGGV
jgi:hypothetical protein